MSLLEPHIIDDGFSGHATMKAARRSTANAHPEPDHGNLNWRLTMADPILTLPARTPKASVPPDPISLIEVVCRTGLPLDILAVIRRKQIGPPSYRSSKKKIVYSAREVESFDFRGLLRKHPWLVISGKTAPRGIEPFRRIFGPKFVHEALVVFPDLARYERTGMTFTYFIAGAGLVKIGKADNVLARMAALQAGSPVVLSLVGLLIGPQATESFCHEKFREHRVHGEWFEFAGAFRVWIEELFDVNGRPPDREQPE